MSEELVNKVVAETIEILRKTPPTEGGGNTATRIEVNKAFNKIIAGTDPKLWNWYLALTYIELCRAIFPETVDKTADKSKLYLSQHLVSLHDRHFVKDLLHKYANFPDGFSIIDIYKLYQTSMYLQFPEQPFLEGLFYAIFPATVSIPSDRTEHAVDTERAKIQLEKIAPFLGFVAPMSQRLAQYPKALQYVLTPFIGLLDVPLFIAGFLSVYLPVLVNFILLGLNTTLINLITFEKFGKTFSELTKKRYDKFKALYQSQHSLFLNPSDKDKYQEFKANLHLAEQDNALSPPCFFHNDFWEISSEAQERILKEKSSSWFKLVFKHPLTLCRLTIRAFFASLVSFDEQQSLWKKIGFVVSWPLRFLIGILLVLFLAIQLILFQILRVIGNILVKIAYTIGSAVRLILSLPHYIAEKRGEFLASFFAMTAAVGLAILVFGINPLLLGIVAAVGFIGALVASLPQFEFFKSPVAKIIFGVLIMLTAATLVFLTFGAASFPLIATSLPTIFSQITALIPAVLPVQIAIAAGIGFITVSLPTLFTGIAKLFLHLKDRCFPPVSVSTEVDGNKELRKSLVEEGVQPQATLFPSGVLHTSKVDPVPAVQLDDKGSVLSTVPEVR